jgi:hypothetical protein
VPHSDKHDPLPAHRFAAPPALLSPPCPALSTLPVCLAAPRLPAASLSHPRCPRTPHGLRPRSAHAAPLWIALGGPCCHRLAFHTTGPQFSARYVPVPRARARAPPPGGPVWPCNPLQTARFAHICIRAPAGLATPGTGSSGQPSDHPSFTALRRLCVEWIHLNWR